MLSMQPVAIVKSVTLFRFKQYGYLKMEFAYYEYLNFDINIEQVKGYDKIYWAFCVQGFNRFADLIFDTKHLYIYKKI